MAKPKAQTLQQRFGFNDPELTTPHHDEIMMWLDENIEAILRDEIHVGAETYDSVVDFFQGHGLQVSIEGKKISCSVKDPIEPIKPEREGRSYSESYWEDCRVYEAALSDFNERRLVLDAFLLLEKSLNRSDLGLDVSRKVWERPILTNNRYTIGFIDYHVTFSAVGVAIGLFGIKEGPRRKDVYNKRLGSIQREIFFEVKPQIRSLGEVMRQLRMYEAYLPPGSIVVVVCPDDRFAKMLNSQGIGFLRSPV